MKVLVTGMAGFIGSTLAARLARDGLEVVGVDNLNDYYDVSLKKARLARLEKLQNVRFVRLDLADREGVDRLFADERFDRVVHLAAQAGVRYSLTHPHAYVDANLVGHLNVLEGCRHQQVEHLLYASSSSVYGMNQVVPFATRDNVDHPVSLYAATKKANELMAHTYSHLYGLPTTGLRFFTVYGPWGRPDMAMFLFTKAILEGRPIDVYNHGEMSRDFTYVDDIVEGIVRLLEVVPSADPDAGVVDDSPDRSSAPYALYNIGHGSPVGLMDFIHAIEAALGRKAEYNFLPMQPGDVPRTWADTTALYRATGYQPRIGVEEGAARFVDWYRSYHGIVA
ncbi:protein CapI [Halomonas litopenaei]|mgnify:CR=1 FL=1|uniref:NAD-dependent epimerase n=3 Tax=Halomonas TaxID=2745 RepID=A0AAU7KCL2_9GAMM|nr:MULTISPECIES: NAD-dependent epimerase [Halomonas]MBR9772632.1 NAD-dependent epimerase [Gammaproteobacteria bacterium]MBY5942864.1 NAD-dependent epimerase [Halomonas sp. DP5N14-9]PTL91032.1 protein CapI [Halomonas sp. SYSU XM8]PTL93984.1 protein CapI [Halomonas litopenaei]|tara:strand:+ start:677 stop:1690 length:1014 start_codon:yes stop_codon:yes gene_type:complete